MRLARHRLASCIVISMLSSPIIAQSVLTRKGFRSDSVIIRQGTGASSYRSAGQNKINALKVFEGVRGTRSLPYGKLHAIALHTVQLLSSESFPGVFPVLPCTHRPAIRRAMQNRPRSKGSRMSWGMRPGAAVSRDTAPSKPISRRAAEKSSQSMTPV